jgi:hypothetical protein
MCVIVGPTNSMINFFKKIMCKRYTRDIKKSFL